MTVLALLQEAEWANRTNVHWVGLTLTLVLAFGFLILPRRWAPLMLLVPVCFIPLGQRIVLLTLDFSLLRILVLVGGLRAVLRREYSGVKLQALDVTIIAWVLASVTVQSLQRGTAAALIYKLGTSLDVLGLYFLFRCFLRGWVDLDRLARILSALVVPVALAFVIERLTGRNLFSVFGGVAELTGIRDGRLRCQGAFAHPILAGCFWAAALPWIGARWWAGRDGRLTAVIGSLCALTAIVLTASSTPVLATAAVLLGAGSFLARRYMAVGRIVLLASLIGLHLVMKAPVWHLVVRLDVVGGSTGYHRFYLIDEAINHFTEWWLLGTPSTRHWGRGLFDVTNQYVAEAVQGGLLGLVLFFGLVVLGFRAVGRVWRSAWPSPARVALAWALGVSLFTQCVAFLGVTNFDQAGILWPMVLACLASMSEASRTQADELVQTRSEDKGKSTRSSIVGRAPGSPPGLSGVLSH